MRLDVRIAPALGRLIPLRTTNTRRWAPVVTLLVVLSSVWPAQAQQAQVTIGAGHGVPGDSADIDFTLTDPMNKAVAAGLFVVFRAGTPSALNISLRSAGLFGR